MLQRGLPPVGIPPAFKHGGDGFHEFFNNIFHVLLETHTLAGGEGQHDRGVGITEVVDIALVGQRHMLSLAFLQQPADRCGAPGAGGAGDEHIEPVVLHGQTEMQCAQCAVLTDNLFQRCDVLDAVDAEHGRCASPAEGAGGKLPMEPAAFHGLCAHQYSLRLV